MKYLFEIIETHSGPKSQSEGIRGYYIADTDGGRLEARHQTLVYVDKTFNYNRWAEADVEEGSICVTRKDLLQARADEMQELGLVTDEYGDVTGDYEALVLWNDGEVAEGSDYYYGVHHFSWRLLAADVSDEDISALTRLGLLGDDT